MSSHPFDKLPLNDAGTLIFTPCPGTKGVELRDSLADLAQAGARAVITLMPDDEMVRNQVSKLPQACEEAGLKWFQFAIEDDTAPESEFELAWQDGKIQVFDILDRNVAVAIHCKGGSGRTGLMAAIIMLELGVPYEEVVAQVKALRPRSLTLAVHVDYLAQNYAPQIRGLIDRA